MSNPELSVIVPATTANLGPGFDSVGLALDLYMSVEVTENKEWSVVYEEATFHGLATDKQNLIVQTILEVASQYGKEVSPLELRVKSDIPLGKGFGSSASAIAAGIVIANHLLDLQLTEKEKVFLGSKLEGHADNISAALLGGAVITYFDEEAIDYIHVQPTDASFVVLVPPIEFKTTEARGLLPNELSHESAVRSSSASAVLTAALAQNDWKTVGKMMEKDCLHEAYRKSLFPHFDEIRTLCKEIGAYGMTISGAGPSLIVAVAQETEDEVIQQLASKFPYYYSFPVRSSNIGATVEQKNMMI